MQTKPKILKLGWEFPPLLTGGLGIACYGLSKALSKFVDLTVIIPRRDSRLNVSQFNLIGLNQLIFEDAAGISDTAGLTDQAWMTEFSYPDYHSFAQVKEIIVDLDPYPTLSKFSVLPSNEILKAEWYASKKTWLINQVLSVKKEILPSIDASEAHALFSDTDVYGPNIMRKVAAYTEVACAIASKLDFDIIHAHDWITFAAAIRIKQKSGKPLVVHIHSLETDRVGLNARNDVYECELKGMQAADRVFPVSNFTRTQIIANYGIEPYKIKTVYNGVEPVEAFHTDKPINEKWVLFLGRVTRQKGPYMILETAKKLLKRMPQVRFYVAGVGDQLGHLKNAVENEGLTAFFVFTGFLNKNQVTKLLSQADVYFMPSISEPFGLSAVEAAQFDIPCVLSKQSGIVELLTNALKADFWDTDKFSDLLYGVLNFKGIRETVITNTRNDLKKISWDTSAQYVSEIYSDLISTS